MTDRDDTQAQLDRLAGRVAELQDHYNGRLATHWEAIEELRGTFTAPTPPPAPAPAQDAPEVFFDPTADEIGRWAKRRRQLRGMTLRDVADATGIAHSHIASFERGGSNISADYLFAICKAVGDQPAGLMLPGEG